VNGPRNQFFPSSAFARDQHRVFEVGDLTDQLINELHLGAGPNQMVEPANTLQLLTRTSQLGAECAAIASLAKRRFQLTKSGRISNQTVSTLLQQIERLLPVFIGSHDHHRNSLGLRPGDNLRNAEIVRAIAGSVKDHGIRCFVGKRGAQMPGVWRANGIVTRQCQPKYTSQNWAIRYYYDTRAGCLIWTLFHIVN
jgi:hypothetical protein